MRKIIFENNKPKFAILCDDYQWILAKTCSVEKGAKVWRDCTYHPNICNLFDELAEYQFKKNAKKIAELKDLEKAVIKVYDLIEKLSVEFQRAQDKASQ